jgi:LacI family transcriptional regulator
MVDVANEARVSQTTVSLVLNHADGARLSAETRKRVVEAAARLGYRPGRRIGAPASAAAASIGFVCDEISTDPWTAIGLDGAREKAWEHGLTVIVMVTRGDADIEAAVFSQLLAQPLLGLIYATINTRLIHAPPPLFRLPAVLLNCHVANGALTSVVPGEVAGGHAVTDALIRAGHNASPMSMAKRAWRLRATGCAAIDRRSRRPIFLSTPSLYARATGSRCRATRRHGS